MCFCIAGVREKDEEARQVALWHMEMFSAAQDSRSKPAKYWEGSRASLATAAGRVLDNRQGRPLGQRSGSGYEAYPDNRKGPAPFGAGPWLFLSLDRIQ